MGPEVKILKQLHKNQCLWFPLCGSLRPFKEVQFAALAVDTHICIMYLIARDTRKL